MLDMDAFFEAVEQRDRPELSALAGDCRWRPQWPRLVATCSYEARRFDAPWESVMK